MNSKKGITPIIAVILLLMMTIAGGAAAFFWFVRMQSEMQGGAETYNEDLRARISSRVEIASTDVQGTENITLYLQNQGTKTIDLDNSEMTMILKNSDNNVVCSSILNDANTLECVDSTCGASVTLTKNEIKAIKITMHDNNCTVESNSLYYFTIDFAGETATGGRFTT